MSSCFVVFSLNDASNLVLEILKHYKIWGQFALASPTLNSGYSSTCQSPAGHSPSPLLRSASAFHFHSLESFRRDVKLFLYFKSSFPCLIELGLPRSPSDCLQSRASDSGFPVWSCAHYKLIHGRSDVTAICGHNTISMWWGNAAYCGEHLSRYSNKNESVGLRKNPYCHLADKDCVSLQIHFHIQFHWPTPSLETARFQWLVHRFGTLCQQTFGTLQTSLHSRVISRPTFITSILVLSRAFVFIRFSGFRLYIELCNTPVDSFCK